MAHVPASGMTEKLSCCVDRSLECQAFCMDTLRHCLQMGGRYATADHIGLLLDCAEICQTAANYMLRGSALHAEISAVCADACESCARECEALGEDDRMRKCAEVCRSCAQACRQMAGGTRVAHAA